MAPFVCVQNHYNLLGGELKREMLLFVSDQEPGIMAFHPLHAELLSGAHVPGPPPPVGSL